MNKNGWKLSDKRREENLNRKGNKFGVERAKKKKEICQWTKKKENKIFKNLLMNEKATIKKEICQRMNEKMKEICRRRIKRRKFVYGWKREKG